MASTETDSSCPIPDITTADEDIQQAVPAEPDKSDGPDDSDESDESNSEEFDDNQSLSSSNIERQITGLSEMLRKLSQSKKSTKIKLETENKRILQENEKLKTELQVATTELSQTKQKYEEVVKTNSAQVTANKNLKDEFDRLSDKNTQLLDENAWMKEEIEKLKFEQEELGHEVKQLRKVNDELMTKNDQLGERKLYYDNEIKQYQRSEEIYKDEIQRLKNENTKLKNDIMPLKEKYKLLNIGYDELSEERKRLGDERILLQNENERLMKIEEKAKSEIVKMKEEIFKLKDQHEDSADEISELKNKINDYRDKNVKLKEIMQSKSAAIKPPSIVKDRATAPPSPGKEEFLEEMNDRLMKQIGTLKIEVVALRDKNSRLQKEVDKFDEIAEERSLIQAANVLKNYQDMEKRLRKMEKIAGDFDKVTTKLLENEKKLKEQQNFFERIIERLIPLEEANETLMDIKAQLEETEKKYQERLDDMEGYEFASDKKRLEQLTAAVLPQTLNEQGFFCRKVPLPNLPDDLIQISQGYNTTSVPYNVASFSPGHFIYVSRERIDKIQKLESLMKIAWGESFSRARIQFRGMPKGRTDWETFSGEIRKIIVVQNLARVNDPDAPDFFMMQCI